VLPYEDPWGQRLPPPVFLRSPQHGPGQNR